MERLRDRTTALLTRLWRASPPLTGAGVLMLVALGCSLIGLVTDPRTIAGAPAWLKPAKFAASTAIYMFTLAWIFTLLPEWSRTRRFIGGMTAGIFVLEVAIIDLQAWRGTTSHFNVGTTFDGRLFAVMGLAIALQTLMSVGVAVVLWRQRFEDRALGWALRLGMAITIFGALTGGLMTRPTKAQIDQARLTGVMPVAGAHTVGAPDGGPGLPGAGWSVQHGDLRVPHFLGLHALQALPLLALVLRRRSNEVARVRLTFAAAASHVSLFAILVWQALRGQALIDIDGSTLAALSVWAILTAVASRVAIARPVPMPSHAVNAVLRGDM
jgi:hypothetical protein